MRKLQFLIALSIVILDRATKLIADGGGQGVKVDRWGKLVERAGVAKSL